MASSRGIKTVRVRFKDHGTVPDVIKRIALELNDKAVESQAKTKNNAEIFRHGDALLRCGGGAVRDTTAMIEALDRLIARYGDQPRAGCLCGTSEIVYDHTEKAPG